MEHGGGKAQARQADATGDLAEQLDGMEVLVNSAAYRINLAAMRACLDAGCHYMDLGGLYHVTAEQLEALRGVRAARPPGPARASARRPGKTNLLAARAVRELPGKPVSISVLAAGRDLDPPEGLSFPYAVRTLLDEITMAPMALINGRPAGDEAAAGRAQRGLRRPDRRGRDDFHPPFGGPHVRRFLRGAERDLCALAVTEGAREPARSCRGRARSGLPKLPALLRPLQRTRSPSTSSRSPGRRR